MSAISPWIGVAGVGIGGSMVYLDVINNPLFYLILLTGAWSSGSRVYNKYKYGIIDPTKPYYYYDIPTGDKGKVIGYYVFVLGAMMYCMKVNDKYRRTPRQLTRKPVWGEEFLMDDEQEGYRQFKRNNGIVDDWESGGRRSW